MRASSAVAALLLFVNPLPAAEPVRYGITHGLRRHGPLMVYQSPSDGAVASQIGRAKMRGQHAGRRLGVTLSLLETEHFLIFTDWPRNQHAWLRDICSRMYQRLVVQFQVSPGTNVWGGKCPVYVFWKIPTFLRFAERVDNMQGAPSVSGYALTGTDGSVHIVMHRQKNHSEFVKVLVHEGSHAFLHRYISNRNIDPWLNEGLAEVMAALMAPKNTVRTNSLRVCRAYVKNSTSIAPVFKSHVWRKRHINHYRIAYMLVESLIARDSAALPRLIEGIKRGLSGEVSLQRSYKMNYKEFEAYFAQYVKSLERKT